MLNRLIRFALENRAFNFILIITIIGLGIYSVSSMPMDSYPDVSNVQVQIATEPENMAAEEVESLVTVPIEYSLNGLPFIKKVRSSSRFGFSLVTAIFDDNCDIYFARQLVQQRLLSLSLPAGVPRPQLGPVVSSFSQIFMYYVTSDNHDLIETRTIQDWNIAKRLLSVQGVANVVTYGGWIKQYQVMLDQSKLKAYGLTVTDILNAVQQSNLNAGGSFIESGDEEIIIRGIGRIKTVSDIEDIVLKEEHGTPVTIKRLAQVSIGPAFRRGSASMNGKGEAVIGIVMSRKGVNTREVVEAVEHKIAKIQPTLPNGIKIVPFYNQKELVDKTMDTVKEVLMLSGSLVIVILAAVLMNIRVALIVSVVIPLSLLFSFIMMRFSGLSANLMTLGAVDFGVVVDAGVVMAENIYRRLSQIHEEYPDRKINTLGVILNAALEVGRPIAFSMVIIISVYLPLFALDGVEGKMFVPLALTFIYALVGALGVAIFIIPVLCFWFLKGKIKERHNPVVEKIKDAYLSCLDRLIKRPVAVIITSGTLLLSTVCILPFLGSEFMPSLDEGSIWLRMRLPPSISHSRTIDYAKMVEQMMTKFPEVDIAVTRIGRSGLGSDVEGVDAADMYLGLKPRHTWKDQNKEHLVDRMAHEMDKIPGIMHSFSQPIADMVDDLITGIKADVGIKIFGPDLKTLDALADKVRISLSDLRGTADTSREPVIGAPELKITLNRHELARMGLKVHEVQDAVQASLAGKEVTEVIEGTKRFGVLVRLQKEQRDTPEMISNLTIQASDKAVVPLKSIADLRVERGAILINREDGQRRAAVMINIRGRDLGSWVKEAQAEIKREVPMPKGYSIVWGGQFENQQHAMQRLSIVVPIVLFLIFILLFFTFHSMRNAALIMLNVPFATIGGVVALAISQQPVSVPALIGFIALFGVAVQNGVILVSYIMQAEKEGMTTLEAIKSGAEVRFRPVLMTAMVAMMGLLPKLFSHGTGAEIQKPLATVVFGGLLSATLMTLLVLPTLYLMTSKPKEEAE
ncbi:efflux RND transporter permease subunit [bacterium]|nr:efflux RND transporter permease subunit [bacterium]